MTEDVVNVLKILFGEVNEGNDELSMDGWANSNPDELSVWVDSRKLSIQQKLEVGFDLNLHD